MQFDKISIYGSAGGIENKAEITAHIRASDCNKLANAEALIAAAPDLLAALEKLIEFAQPALEAQGFGYMGSFEQARAAIAKAKGQQ